MFRTQEDLELVLLQFLIEFNEARSAEPGAVVYKGYKETKTRPSRSLSRFWNSTRAGRRLFSSPVSPQTPRQEAQRLGYSRVAADPIMTAARNPSTAARRPYLLTAAIGFLGSTTAVTVLLVALSQI